jgi:hypothetical protein
MGCDYALASERGATVAAPIAGSPLEQPSTTRGSALILWCGHASAG